MNFDEKARSAIESIIKPWTSKYLYNITLVDSTTPEQIYMVQFSLPTSDKPIPIATVQVYFYIEPTTPLQIKFKFQKDSLIHTVNQTIRSTQMENLIESLLHKKLLIRENVFYLGTDYEVTRVKDKRQDKILQEKEIPIEEEYVYISPELLVDQKRTIEMQARTLSKDHLKLVYNSFLLVDKDGLGVVTNEELVEILNSLQLKLDENDVNEIIAKVDKDKQGLITFEEYKLVADEIVKTMIAKDQAVVKLKNNEEEYQLSSVMMIINNNIHGIYERVAEKFKKIDEDELGYLRLPDVKAVLEEINVQVLRQQQNRINKKQKRDVKPPSKLRQGQKMRNDKPNLRTNEQTPQPLLTLMQLQEFTKKLSEKYPFAQVKYHNIVKQLLDFKLHNLRKGLLDSNQTLLQSHLRQIFTNKDNDRLNKIHISELIKALEQDDKIKLTKGQLYVVKSIVEKDSKDMVGYLAAAKLLSEVLKRMYLTHEKRREEVKERTEMEKEMLGGEVEEVKEEKVEV